MVFLLASTGCGVGGAEPGTVSLGALSFPRPCAFGGRSCRDGLTRARAPPPVRLRLSLQAPGLSSAWAPRPRPPSGSAGEEETWLPPGDNARENLDSTSRRGREPGSPTSGLPRRHLRSQVRCSALLGQGPLTLLLTTIYVFLSRDSDPFYLVPFFPDI